MKDVKTAIEKYGLLRFNQELVIYEAFNGNPPAENIILQIKEKVGYDELVRQLFEKEGISGKALDICVERFLEDDTYTSLNQIKDVIFDLSEEFEIKQSDLSHSMT